jgi:hypothetical protein
MSFATFTALAALVFALIVVIFHCARAPSMPTAEEL